MEVMVFVHGDLWFLAALTPVHVGVGRSPGVVDLPIARDSFGYPWIPASGLKGVIKSSCLLLSSDKDRWECYKYYGWDIEIAENVSEYWVSAISFTDGFLLAFPTRALVDGEEKIVYIVPESSRHRLIDLSKTIPCHGEVERKYSDVIERKLSLENTNEVELRLRYFNVKAKEIELKDMFEEIRVYERLPSLVKQIIENGVYVIDDSIARHIVEMELIRVTRIRLKPDTKTVKEGALWSEEYVPQATVFAAATFYRETKAKDELVKPSCAREYQRRLLQSIGWTVFLGGKETIGRGLVKIIEWGATTT